MKDFKVKRKLWKYLMRDNAVLRKQSRVNISLIISKMVALTFF